MWLTREDLNALVAPTVAGIVRCCTELLAANGMVHSGLAGVLATGGATRSPAILAGLHAWHPVTPGGTHPPEQVTAYGLVTGTAYEPPMPGVPAARLPITGHAAKLQCLDSLPYTGELAAFTSDSTEIVVFGRGGGPAIDLRTRATRMVPGSGGGFDVVNGVADRFAYNGGSLYLYGLRDGFHRKFDQDGKTMTPMLAFSDNGLHLGVWTHDGQWSGSGATRHTFTLRDGRDGTVVRTVRINTDLAPESVRCPYKIAVSPDGLRVVAMTSGGFVVWDATSGQPCGAWENFAIRPVAVAFEGPGYAMVFESNRIIYYDATKPRSVGSIPLAGELTCYATSAEPGMIATGQPDGTIQVFVAAACHAILLGHEDKITALAFSPDGTLLSSSSEDGTTRIWGIPQ